MYIGLESTRMEMFRTHQFIKNNEQELLNMDLKAWYAKGFNKWYLQDPTEFDSLLKNFININNIKVKKLIQNSENYVNENVTFYEHPDSTFYDITLLSKQDVPNLNTTFYIGVQNRRTDPLIYFTEDTTNKHILFLSTEEFNDLCDFGGQNPLTGINYADTTWQNYHWKRQGTREISIPFNYKHSDPSQYCLLHVEELKADPIVTTEEYNNWAWWRQDRYDKYIDTWITQDNILKVNFLPGEGKIFKVTVHPPQTAHGNLNYSNQTKMVGHPIIEDGKLSDSLIRYHLVYHKKEQNDSVMKELNKARKPNNLYMSYPVFM